jgi:hypothetical protein
LSHLLLDIKSEYNRRTKLGWEGLERESSVNWPINHSQYKLYHIERWVIKRFRYPWFYLYSSTAQTVSMADTTVGLWRLFTEWRPHKLPVFDIAALRALWEGREGGALCYVTPGRALSHTYLHCHTRTLLTSFSQALGTSNMLPFNLA